MGVREEAARRRGAAAPANVINGRSTWPETTKGPCGRCHTTIVEAYGDDATIVCDDCAFELARMRALRREVMGERFDVPITYWD